MAAAEQLGEPTIALVNDDCTLWILHRLRNGPVPVSQIASDMPVAMHETIMRRLRKLGREGFLLACDETGTPLTGRRRARSDACYLLTALGRVLLDLPDDAAWCEARLPAPVRATLPGPPGMRALGLAADATNRLIVRALADGPLQTAELTARIPDVHRTTVHRRLGQLAEERLILRTEAAGHVMYELTDPVRQLARILLRAARCEWLRDNPVDRTRVSDLPGLLHVLAPLARIPAGLASIYLLEIESERTLERRVYLTAAAGKICPMPTAPTGTPLASGRGDLAACCEALLTGDPSYLTSDGDPALAKAVLRGFARVLRKPRMARTDVTTAR